MCKNLGKMLLLCSRGCLSHNVNGVLQLCSSANPDKRESSEFMEMRASQRISTHLVRS